jgi:iron complex transport system ATP-binding protein
MARRIKKLPLLQIQDLSLRREIQILSSISWRVQSGEHWVILGPNGSGKTSLLAALTAYLTPSSGSIEVLGKKYGETDWREHRKQVGIVSSAVYQIIREDETALKAVASGKDAILNFWGNPSPADSKKALQILKKVECSALSDRPWGYFSQGERQRILIGRALMADPKILILDEPCAGLDLVAREHFLGFLQKMTQDKKSPTLILVTHHVEEIVPGFSHVLILKKGKALASGPKEKTITSRHLSQAFGTLIKVQKSKGRYQALVSRNSSKVI